MEIPRSCIPVAKLENDSYDWDARHTLKCKDALEKRFKAVFIGDSITHFWTDEDSAGRAPGYWKQLYGGLPIQNLGYGFDRTQNVLWRMENGELEGQDPALFVINIGTNHFSITPNYSGDTPEIAVQGILKVLQTIRTRWSKAHIVDMALFPRLGKTADIVSVNRILRQEVPKIPETTFIDLGPMLGNAQGGINPLFYCPDGCHLCENGYRVWAAALAPFIDRYVR